MKFQDLENALKANHTLSVKNGEVRAFGPDSLDKTLPAGVLSPFFGASRSLGCVDCVAADGVGAAAKIRRQG